MAGLLLLLPLLLLSFMMNSVVTYLDELSKLPNHMMVDTWVARGWRLPRHHHAELIA
jgi:hypothetical protein